MMKPKIGLITTLHHVAIIVSDMERAKDFYVGVLGGKILAENFRAERQSWKVDVALANIQLELFTFLDAPQRPSRPEAEGLRHLAFTVSDIDEEHSRLQSVLSAYTVEDIRRDPYTQKRFFFIADPDGLPIEFYEA